MSDHGRIPAARFLLSHLAFLWVAGAATVSATARAGECRLPIPFHAEAETRVVDRSSGAVRQDWSSWSIDFDGDEVMMRWPANSHQHWNRFTIERCVATGAGRIEMHYRSANADRAGDRNRLDLLRWEARDRHDTPSLSLQFFGDTLVRIEGFRFSSDPKLGELLIGRFQGGDEREGAGWVRYEVRGENDEEGDDGNDNDSDGDSDDKSAPVAPARAPAPVVAPEKPKRVEEETFDQFIDRMLHKEVSSDENENEKEDPGEGESEDNGEKAAP